MPNTRLTIAALLLLPLAACHSEPEQKGNVEAPVREANNAAPANIAVPDVPANATAGNAAGPSDNAIPAAFQGRWGMVRADCGPDAAIAKGLMVVDGEKMRFYESVAKPAVVSWPTPTRMEGRFSFSGEGMDWSKDMVVEVQGNNDTLVRTEKDPAATYRYTRCKS